MKKRLLGKVLSLILAILMSVLSVACGKESPNTHMGTTVSSDAVKDTPKDTVVILYTNDIHAYLDNDSGEEPGISYADLAGLKKELGDNTLLVDAGDHIQGAVYGAMDEGQSVLEIMNRIYDLATLGNHEFDYGIERTLSVTANSEYPYISCNFVYKDSGETVVEPHKMFEVGNVKIGFVGITTPETLSSTAPVYFQNGDGEYVYDFLDNDELYSAVQSSVDELKNEGADYVIALGHVGVDPSGKITSYDIIENVSGLNAFIDGHSHTEMAGESVKDKDGKEVVLTQTGYYFGGIGKMTVGEDGIKTEIIKECSTKDDALLKAKNEWVQAVDEMLGEKIGTVEFPLNVNDENGNRIVRVDGTNLGEFVADSYYYYVNFVSEIDCDAAIINGGGVRQDIAPGDVSYKDLKTVNPFGNMICAIELSGQQILDMLEWGARATTGEPGQYESGAFLHTAGITYTVDTSVASTVQMNDQELWTGAPTGEYRVRDVQIYDKVAKAYVDLDLAETYVVAGANFTLISKGDGFEMINGSTVKDYIVEDYMALAVYAIAFEDVDGDDLSDITTENSPLGVYENYRMNYEELAGANRVNVEK